MPKINLCFLSTMYLEGKLIEQVPGDSINLEDHPLIEKLDKILREIKQEIKKEIGTTFPESPDEPVAHKMTEYEFTPEEIEALKKIEPNTYAEWSGLSD